MDKYYIYLDKNILHYLSNKLINLPADNTFHYIYSDEHFSEAERSGDTFILDILNDIKACKMRIVLDANFKITNNFVIFEFADAHKLYNDYIQTKYEVPNFSFNPLLAFFYGNKDSLNIDEFIVNYKNTLKTIIHQATAKIEAKIELTQFDRLIDQQAIEFKSTLEKAHNQIKPLDKTRKLISRFQFSNLEPKDGPIIDQIWNKLNHFEGISKEVLFGKTQFINSFNYIEWPLLLGIAQCHTALNFLGYWPDEDLTKLSKIYGINSDASHIAHAAFLSGIMSADDRLCKKASAIFEYFSRQTKVIKIELIKK